MTTRQLPPTTPLLRLIAQEIVREYLAELEAEQARSSNDESNSCETPLARTGTDGE